MLHSIYEIILFDDQNGLVLDRKISRYMYEKKKTANKIFLYPKSFAFRAVCEGNRRTQTYKKNLVL